MKIKIEKFTDRLDLQSLRVYSPYNKKFIEGAWKLMGKFNKSLTAWEFPASEWKILDVHIQNSYGVNESYVPELFDVEITFLEKVRSIGEDIAIAGHVLVKAGLDKPLANIGWNGADAGSYFDKEENQHICFIEEGSEIQINDLDKEEIQQLKSDSRISVRVFNN